MTQLKNFHVLLHSRLYEAENDSHISSNDDAGERVNARDGQMGAHQKT
jgi:hypothetical protein